MKYPLKQKAYRHVLDKIMAGTYKPGAKLSEVAVAREIGISPTPLREAYRQLASEGFVRYVPNSGTFVRDIGEPEISELYEAREAMEPFCAGLAALKMNMLMIGDLESCLSEMLAIARQFQSSGAETLSPAQEIRYLKADTRFHMLILNAAQNKLLQKAMRECHILERLLSLKRHKHTLRQVATSLRQHDKIFKAIRSHDSARAELAMREHIRFSRKTALKNSTAQGPLPGSGPEEDFNNFIYETA